MGVKLGLSAAADDDVANFSMFLSISIHASKTIKEKDITEKHSPVIIIKWQKSWLLITSFVKSVAYFKEFLRKQHH